jgi:aspartate-semialdehyde dehydrogenase
VKKYAVAVVGATGLVGRKMSQVLEEHRFPVGEILLLASARSVGKTVTFAQKEVPVRELTPGSFAGVDIALFSAGAAVSREYAPRAVRAGTFVVDNSSAFRLDAGVPLVVPEVNRADIFKHRGIVANPNCSTIQMVVALKPLHDLWKIRRIVVSTYQSVTGAGKKGLTQLEDEIAQRPAGEKKFPHQIAFNVLPQIDVFLEDGSSKEEYKMVEETKKIMGDDTIRVSATCVRVPVWGGHSESVNVEFEKPCDVAAARAALAVAPGVIVRDDLLSSEYPMPVDAWDTDPVYVGRIRRDPTVPSGLNLWIVADNLRKGAATNAVQIAEEWIKGQ